MKKQKKQYFLIYCFIICISIYSVVLALNAPNNLKIIKSVPNVETPRSYEDVVITEPRWANLSLPTSRIEKLNLTDIKTVSGEKYKKIIKNKSTVTLKDIILKVKWDSSYSKYGTTLFYIRNCKNVLIENVIIIQIDPDYRASHSVLIEDSDNVTIKNCIFLGTNNSYHLRIEGCNKVKVDGVEISGYDYGSLGKRCGGGIFINNGNQPEKLPNTRGMYSLNPKDLTSLVIENCYIHDNLANDGNFRNQDGVALSSPGNGIFFNNIIENWLRGDAGLDMSHRRWDEAYRNKIFKIERNVFKNCSYQKFSGRPKDDVNNIIVTANNIFINTSIGYYPKNYQIIHIYDTFINTAPSTNFKPFIRLWGVESSSIKFLRCLFYSKYPHNFFWDSKGAPKENYQLEQMKFNECYFIFDNLKYWYINKDNETISSINKFVSLYPRIFSNSNTFDRDIGNIILNSYIYSIVDSSKLKLKRTSTEIQKIIDNFNIKSDFFGHNRKLIFYPGAIIP